MGTSFSCIHTLLVTLIGNQPLYLLVPRLLLVCILVSRVLVSRNLGPLQLPKTATMTFLCDAKETDDEKPSQGPTKVRAIGSTDKEKDERELNHLILTAQNAEQTRLLSAAVYITAIVLRAIAEPAIAVVKELADKTRGKSGHKLGQPHTQLWASLLTQIIKIVKEQMTMESPGEITQALQTVETYLNDFKNSGVEQAYMWIDRKSVV